MSDLQVTWDTWMDLRFSTVWEGNRYLQCCYMDQVRLSTFQC